MDQPVQISNENSKIRLQIPSRKLLLFCAIGFIILVLAIGIYFFITTQSSTHQMVTPQSLDELDKDSIGVTSKNKSSYILQGYLLNIKKTEDYTSLTFDLGKGIVTNAKTELFFPVITTILPDVNNLPLAVTAIVTCNTSNVCILDELKIKNSEVSINDSTLQKIVTPLNAWVGKQKNLQGIYQLGEICTVTGDCRSIGPDNRAGISVIWALYRLSKGNLANTANLQSTIQSDLEVYNEILIQNDYLNCTLMYEIWQDVSVSQKIKDLAKTLCFGGSYTDSVPEGLSVNQILQSKDTVLNNTSINEDIRYFNEGISLERAAAFASDYATLSVWQNSLPPQDESLKSSSYIELAKLWFASSLEQYKDSNLAFHPQSCTMGTAALSLQKATGDSSYRVFATKLFDKLDLDKQCASSNSSSHCGEVLRVATLCADFAQRLYEETNDSAYTVTRDAILTHLINTSYDLEPFPGVVLNNGAFYNRGSTTNSQKANLTVPLQANAILLGLLSFLNK